MTMEDYRPPADDAARLRILCLRIGFVALLALTGLVLWLATDLVFYTSERVKLDHVGTYCFAQYKGRSQAFHPPTNPTQDCKGLENRIRRDVQLSYYRLVKDTFVTFRYVSSTDGRRYEGMLRRNLNDAGELAKAGDEITVHASRLFATTFTDWSSASAHR